MLVVTVGTEMASSWSSSCLASVVNAENSWNGAVAAVVHRQLTPTQMWVVVVLVFFSALAEMTLWHDLDANVFDGQVITKKRWKMVSQECTWEGAVSTISTSAFGVGVYVASLLKLILRKLMTTLQYHVMNRILVSTNYIKNTKALLNRDHKYKDEHKKNEQWKTMAK